MIIPIRPKGNLESEEKWKQRAIELISECVTEVIESEEKEQKREEKKKDDCQH